MARERATNPDFLNGVPELVVLRLLARQPMHGYEVVRAIKAASADRLDFGEGCIYPVLHKLERAGLLAADRERVGNRPRIVYRVTPAGEARLADATAAWRAAVDAVARVLNGGTEAPPALA